MARLILFNKPFNVLSQFTDSGGRATLADFIRLPAVYPAGRLDRDSEGLLLLTDNGPLAHELTHPHKKVWKTYWAQVEGEINEAALTALRNGVQLKDGPTLPAQADRIAEPDLWPRDPPIRFRASIPTSWLALSIREGRNRQVRRMTAAVGHPTLRLVRVAVGEWGIDGIEPGQYRTVQLPPSSPKSSRRPPARQRKRHRSG